MMTFVSPEKSTTPVRANLFGSATEGNAPCGMANPKGGLGVWSYHTLMGFEDDIFKITPMAIDINDTRALHVAGLVRDGLRNQIKTFFAAGYEVKGLGRGHMKRLKEEVAEK